MWSDPIVEETHRLRDEFSKKHNYNIRAMVKELKQWQQEGYPLPAGISQEVPSKKIPIPVAWQHNQNRPEPLLQIHFFTIDEIERDIIINDYPEEIWKYEGIAWYVYPVR